MRKFTDEVVDAATEIRRRAGLCLPAFSTSRVVKLCFPEAVVIGHSLPGGIDEVVSRTEHGVVIVYRRDLSICERRFAVAHAIGHLVFGDVPDGPRYRGVGGSVESEARADAFAAELLVPLIHLERYLEVGHSPHAKGDGHESYLDHVDQLASRFKAHSRLIDARIRELIPVATSD